MVEHKTIDEQEKEILKFWEKDKTFEKSLEKTKDKKPYVFYDGPPFATGLPHYGHILASIEKDVIPRFWTMNGRYVKRTWGWDCHGLPIENIAEKELGINSKDEIEKMGIEKFNKFCKEKVFSYDKEWQSVIKRIGRWVDFEKQYKTMDNEYIESVWWAFKTLWEKDLIYEGEKILMYCPRCSTPLAKSEVAMDNSYKTIRERAITVKFELEDEKNTYILAWTTTPWTLPSNLALALNPKLEYAYVKDKDDGNTYILAKELIDSFYKSEDQYTITKTVTGKELENKKYKPLFPYFKHLENSFRTILGDFVTAEDGTGIVHIAPAFGEDDYLISKKNNIDFIQPVDETGKFTEEVTDFAGELVFDTNKKIIDKLKEEGNLVKAENNDHEYPFCHRCDTKLIYRALPALFVNIQKVKSRLLKLNKNVNWYPNFLKEGRVQHTLETAPDWNISRNRYWAASIPLWKCEKCSEIKVLGSIEELKNEAKKLTGKVDLHKDYVDKVELKCSCGDNMKRIPDVFDCWFESGSMPYAQYHYPFENKEMFENHHPADFVAEGLDQTRGWFYTLAVLSTALFDKAPFKNVLVNGMILAEDGKKMSKKLKNYPNPQEIIDKYGVDALRFYLMSSSVMNADNFNFAEKGLEEVYKKVLVLLYNVKNFYELYEKIPINKKPDSKHIVDKWIISKTEELVEKVGEHLKNYNTIKACVEIREFIEGLSTWYVRLSRDRFAEGNCDSKTTLNYILGRLSLVIAPLMPFVAEKIFQKLNGEKESVHLADWPKSDKKKIDENLVKEMETVREVVSNGLRTRDQKQIGLKWPLAKAIAILPEKIEISDTLNEIIKDQLNVKDLEIKSGSEFSVELDIKMTPELEAEGFAREISRRVQAGRRKIELNQEDKITLTISSEFDELLKSQKTFISDRVGAKTVDFGETKENSDYSDEGKIKNKNFSLKFNKV